METLTYIKGGKEMNTKIARIMEIIKAHPTERLQSLAHLINVETLTESHKKMEGNKASGIDKMTKAEYATKLEENINNLVDRMKRQAYKPLSVRRVYIPKVGSQKLRPLGIPAYEDKLVQSVLSQILTAIYEPMFLDCSYGFRPGRSCHQAVARLDKILHAEKIGFIVDADIKGFFDNVSHEWMMKFLEYKIQDPNLLRMLKRFLKAGVIEEGKYYDTDKGTPQGGLISPILANIYLHFVLDLWFEKKIAKEFKGTAKIVRYADDFVCCFQFQNEAEKFYEMLKERLKEFNLELAEDKTRIIEFGRFAKRDRGNKGEGKPETFDFLGFTHYCSTGQNGKFRVKRKTSRKKFIAKAKAVRIWIKENMHTPINQLIKKINTKLVGHYRYYGITDNTDSIRKFHDIVKMQLFKSLNRRSQKNRYSWEYYWNDILKRFPIAKPRIYLDIVAASFKMT